MKISFLVEAQIEFDEVIRDDLLSLFCDTCQFNPRKLKRQCLLLKLNWQVAKNRQITDQIKPVLLAKLVMIQTGHRGLYNKLLDKQSGLLIKLEEAYSIQDAQRGFDKVRGNLPEKTEQHKSEETEDDSKGKDQQPLPYMELPWLKDLLYWRGQEREGGVYTFTDLFRQQGSIEQHLQLRAWVESGPAMAGVETAFDPDNAVLRDLLHEDISVIASAVDRINPNLRHDYARHLQTYLEESSNPWRQRVSAGDALGYLGDPRLDGPIHSRQNYWKIIAAGKFYRGVTDKDAPGANENNIDGKAYSL